jgi:hypothetical protein
VLGCVRAWLVDSIVRVADSLSFSLFLSLSLAFLFFSVRLGGWRLDGGALGGCVCCCCLCVRPCLFVVQRRMLCVCIDGLHRGILCKHYISRLRSGTAGTFRGQVEGDEV